MSVCNGAQYLKESISSILAQSYDDFEFLIVNDGSTDNSLELAQRFGANDKRLRVLENKTNIGLTRSLNRAIGDARGEYVARHDADDVALPDRFRQQVDWLDRESQCAVVGTNYLIIDADGGTIARGNPSHHTDNTAHTFARGLNPLCHSSVMFRKAIVQNAGLYDEEYRYAQDYELWLRLIVRGYGMCNIPAKLQKIRHSGQEIAVKHRRARWLCVIRIQHRYLKHFWRSPHYIAAIFGRHLRFLLPASLTRTR